MPVTSLSFVDHRRDPAAWASTLGISREAIEIYLSSDVIDLHIDSFIWTRVFGYDLTQRHGHGPFGARFFSQLDLPRLREARITGGIWSITTNPLRPKSTRRGVFSRNLAKLRGVLESCGDDVRIVRNASDYRAAKREEKHAAWIGIQGGNALESCGDDLSVLDDGSIVRVTIVHLSKSGFGQTSAPSLARGETGLTNAGRDFVKQLNSKRIFVDLAHIHRRGFFDAVDAHDQAQPLIVTHTGVTGVHPHWRNLDDEQIRAVAHTGGVIGVMYQSSFLGAPMSRVTSEHVVDHLEHIAKVGGEDTPSLGSDWDGMIIPPKDMPTCLELPRVAEVMCKRGWKPERISKTLGGNYLRALEALRG